MNDIIFLLMERNKNKSPWTQQEIAILARLYPQLGSKKWKKISEEMRQNGFERSEIEVRERWVNFDDPLVNKNRWEEWELARLYDIHDQVGTKWCVIQKYVGRTQNMIKNRFYGTLRNFIRFLVNQLGNRRESFNKRISKLSPKVLNDIYKSDNQFKFTGEEIKQAIYSMKFKIDKQILAQRFRAKRPLYQKLKNIVCRIFEEMKADLGEASEEAWVEDAEEEREEENGKAEGQAQVKQEEVRWLRECSEADEGVKAESLQEVYPFLEKEAEDMKFKVEEQPVFYPFLTYCSFEGFQATYRPLSMHCTLD